jgi:hypothetical protein
MKNQKPQLRRFPYPWRAMLAICSDLDETPDRQTYWEIMRYLNTCETTTMGPGIGLEVGNSIYFDMPALQFAYWNTDDAGRAMIQNLIRSGHIDCIHSFGDLALNRSAAAKSLNELNFRDCRIKTWIDHARVPTNFGSDIMQGHGDQPDHDAYHADLSTQYGIRYVSRGRVTSVIGQGTNSHYNNLFQVDHPIDSGRTILKEFTKHALGRFGYPKYKLNACNDVMTEISLRDGRKVFEFLRSNPCWQGVSAATTAEGLSRVLTDSFLQNLVHRQGFCILYTHLGKIKNPKEPLGPQTRSALDRLAHYAHSGQILVTTTSRLLDYVLASRTIFLTVVRTNGRTTINLIRNHLPEHNLQPVDIPLDGISIDLPADIQVDLLADGNPIPYERKTQSGSSAIATLTIPWTKLQFPNIGKDSL